MGRLIEYKSFPMIINTWSSIVFVLIIDKNFMAMTDSSNRRNRIVEDPNSSNIPKTSIPWKWSYWLCNWLGVRILKWSQIDFHFWRWLIYDYGMKFKKMTKKIFKEVIILIGLHTFVTNFRLKTRLFTIKWLLLFWFSKFWGLIVSFNSHFKNFNRRI